MMAIILQPIGIDQVRTMQEIRYATLVQPDLPDKSLNTLYFDDIIIYMYVKVI